MFSVLTGAVQALGIPADAALDPAVLGVEAFLKLILDAALAGNWAFVGAALLVAAVFLVRKYVAPKVPFLASDLGGGLLVILGSAAGAVAAALQSGGGFTWALAIAALKVSFMAAGGYSLLKKALVPLAKLVLSKVGGLKGLLGALFTRSQDKGAK